MRGHGDSHTGGTPATDLKEKSAFTLIELLVVIAIIAILAAMIFPVLSAARERSHIAVCHSNLHQIGLGIQAYTGDWDGRLPLNSNWPAHPVALDWGKENTELWFEYGLRPYLQPLRPRRTLWICPSDPFSDWEPYLERLTQPWELGKKGAWPNRS